MDALCVTQPWVVKTTRPNIYNQEHTIMNNARYGGTAQRTHGPVCDAQRFIIQFVLCLFLGSAKRQWKFWFQGHLGLGTSCIHKVRLNFFIPRKLQLIYFHLTLACYEASTTGERA